MRRILVFFVIILAVLFSHSVIYSQSMYNPMDISVCIERASLFYGINPLVLWGIAKIESGFNPMALNKNNNGTYDIGLMQINSSWFPRLGVQDMSFLWDPCYNIHVGAWILRNCINRHGNSWEAVGCYNTKSKYKKVKYAWRVYNAIKPYLATNFKK